MKKKSIYNQSNTHKYAFSRIKDTPLKDDSQHEASLETAFTPLLSISLVKAVAYRLDWQHNYQTIFRISLLSLC